MQEDTEIDVLCAQLSRALHAGAGGEAGKRLLRRIAWCAGRDLVLGPGEHEESELAYVEDVLFDLLDQYNAALGYQDPRPRLAGSERPELATQPLEHVTQPLMRVLGGG